MGEKSNKKVRFEISGVDETLYNKIKNEAKKESLTASALVREILKLYFN